MERLSAQDAVFIYGETPSNPMHVGCLALVEAAPLRGPDGKFALDRVIAHVSSRIHLAPNFRRKLVNVPLYLGHPVWVDDPAFDAARHVRLIDRGSSVTASDLHSLMEELWSEPLPRDRPLWDLSFVDGLEGGTKVALIQRTHHALSDGVSAVQFANLLYDLTPRYKEVVAEPYRPEPQPGKLTLVQNALKAQLAAARELAERAVADWKRQDYKSALHLGSVRAITKLCLKAERNLLTVDKPSIARRWLPVSTPLAPLKALARASGGTINDVIVAQVVEATRRYLEEHGHTASELQTFIPFSTRSKPSEKASGNTWAGLPVTLPCARGELIERVKGVHGITSAVKDSTRVHDIARLYALAEISPPLLQRALAGTRFGMGLRNIHLSISNLPGPPAPLYVLGARILDMQPASIMPYHSALTVLMLSYDGKAYFGISTQADTLPDIERFIALLDEELRAVTTAFAAVAERPAASNGAPVFAAE